jgi:HK97 family phage major capsid protein
MKELIQKRSEAAQALRSMLNTAEKENRFLSAEEKTKYDRIADDIANYDDMIKRKKQADEIGDLEALEMRIVPQTGTPAHNQAKGGDDAELFRAFLQGNLVEYNLSKGENPNKRAFTSETGETGGFLIPTTFSNKLFEVLNGENPIRKLATTVPWGVGDGAFPVTDSFGTSYLVGEGSPVTESNATFQQKTVSGYQLMYMAKPYRKQLAVSAFNLESLIPQWWGKSDAVKEQALFAVGNGTTEPIGLAVAATNGTQSALNSAIAGDDIINWYHDLKPGYRRNASWLFPDATIKLIRKIKNPVDTSGALQYLWNPGLGGNPDTLMNRPIYPADGFAAFAANTKIGVFGDISQYQIVEWGGPQMLRDPYTDAAYAKVRFIGWRLIDTALPLAEAVISCRIVA